MKSAVKRLQPARGPLRSMRVSASFREFVLDQLADLEGLRARAMFGGVGLYADDVFIAILVADELFFKVDDTNRREYEKAGSAPFKRTQTGR
jgi:DNA transformation protein